MTAAALPPRDVPSAASVRSGEFLFAETQIASVGDCKHTQPPLNRSCRCHQGQKPPANTHHTWIYLLKPCLSTWCERVFCREQRWARLEWFWGVYIVWDSTSNLVPVSDKLEATTWRTTYPTTVRCVGSIRFCSRTLTGLRFVNGCHLKPNCARTAQWWRCAERFITNTTALGLLTGGTMVYDGDIVVLQGTSTTIPWYFCYWCQYTLVLFV